MKVHELLLNTLYEDGPGTRGELAASLEIDIDPRVVSARLTDLEHVGLIFSKDYFNNGVGRPSKIWHCTELAKDFVNKSFQLHNSRNQGKNK